MFARDKYLLSQAASGLRFPCITNSTLLLRPNEQKRTQKSVADRSLSDNGPDVIRLFICKKGLHCPPT